jgi:hypothetical protein
MKAWKIVGLTVLFALAASYVYQEIQFRKPLTATEVDGLAAITAGQMDCNWRYDSTRKGERLRQRSVAQKKLDATLEARWRAALRKYQGLSADEQCALLDKFPDLVRRWHD